jgi:hypothetical protein
MTPNRILWFGYPYKIFTSKSFRTGGVNFVREIAENFFKLCIAQRRLCIMPLLMWITLWISKGKI